MGINPGHKLVGLFASKVGVLGGATPGQDLAVAVSGQSRLLSTAKLMPPKKQKSADAVQTDPRFARIHSDPRFQRLPQQQNKVKVDKRFSRLFTDKEFKVVKQSAPVDSKGRKSKSGSDDALQRRFEMDEDDEAAAPTKKKKRLKAEAEEEEEEDEDEEEEYDGKAKYEEGEGSTTEDDSDDDDEVEGEDDEDEEEESALLSFIQEQASVTRVKDATSRLAVVNCDWEQMRAVDLLVMLRSFVPSGGSIRSVGIYLSDLGAEQQRLEAVRGPSGIWEEADDDDDDDDDVRGGKRKSTAGRGGKDGVVDGGKVDNEKLRKYELDRFKHFYGVVTCDSARTADAIYTECDGTELEASSMVLDLRFIPEDMSFVREPRDEATEVPAKYTTPAFASTALQQSTVTSTWDADDNERKKAMQRDFKKSGMKEIEYSKYLASESDDDGDGVEEYPFLDAPLAPPKGKAGGGGGASALRALGVGGGGGGGGGVDEEGSEGDDEMTHELTYLPALEEKTRQKAKRREMGLPDEPEAPSVFELEEQKRAKKAKQRKQERLAARNGGGAAAAAADEADDADADDDDGMSAGMADDPFFAEAMAERDEEDRQARGVKPPPKGRAAAASSSAADSARGEVDRRKGKKGKKGRPVLTPEEAAAEAKRAAELELLLMDGDAEDVRGYDAKQLELPAGGRNIKGKRRARDEEKAAAATAAAAEDGFKLDAADTRFEKLFRSSDYAIDPTHPKFKRTVASEQLMEEVLRRHEVAPAKPEPAAKGAGSDPVLAKLVSSLKAKGKAKAKGKSPAK